VKKYNFNGRKLTAAQFVKAMKKKYGYEGDLPPMYVGITGHEPDGSRVRGLAELPPAKRPTWEEYAQLREIVEGPPDPEWLAMAREGEDEDE
jgi:hypothetical protein